jgi:hypothetical protein
MRRTMAAVGMAALLSLGGCFSTTYVAKSMRPSATKIEKDMTFFWWGLSGTAVIDTAEACAGRGAARVNTQQTFTDSLLGIVTLGIYVPRTAFITCSE